MKIDKTEGLVAAPPTGFRDDGGIDVAVVAPLAAHLHRQGVAGVFVNGTTGEGLSLSMEERLALAEEWRRVLPSPMRLFVHVGHNSLPEAKRLAEHSAAIGADAIAAIGPVFYKPGTCGQLVDWCAEISASAPGLPFYYYHIPGMTGIALSMPRFLAEAAGRIPGLAGIKFTFEALADYQQCLEFAGGRYDVLWGRDEMLLGALATGARGTVGSTYNIAAPLFLDVMRAFRQGDPVTARALQAKAAGMIAEMAASGSFFAALKEVLREQGVPISGRVRPPLPPLDEGSFKVPTVPEGTSGQ
jgi:N-acetylneuraminate lyase